MNRIKYLEAVGQDRQVKLAIHLPLPHPKRVSLEFGGWVGNLKKICRISTGLWTDPMKRPPSRKQSPPK